MVSLIKRGREIKRKKERARFDAAFHKRVEAEVGSEEYRALWAYVQAAIYGKLDQLSMMTVVAAAFGHWADVALDEDRPDGERLLAGRIAQFALYYYNRCDGGSTVLGVEPAAAKERGDAVSKAVTEMLRRNPTAPAGLFDHGSAASREMAYHMFKLRMLADRIGWETPKDHAARAQFYKETFETGFASDLMWLDKELEQSVVAHAYRAFVLALHAGAWARAGEYGIHVLNAFPKILTERIENIKPMLEDEEVWPGVAATMALRRGDLSSEVCRVLDMPDPKYVPAMTRIREMMAGVQEGMNYLSVLKIGE